MALGSGGGIGGSSSSSTSNLSALAPPFTVGRLNPKPNSNPLLKFTGAPTTWQYPSRPSDNRPEMFPKPELVVDGSTRTTPMPLSNDYRYSGSESINLSSSQWSLNSGGKAPTNAYYVAEESVNPSITQWSGLTPGVKSPSNDFYVAEESVNSSSSQWSGLPPSVTSPTNAYYVAEVTGNPSNSQWSGINLGVKSPTNAFYVAEESAYPSSTHWSGLNPSIKSSTSSFFVAEGKSYCPAYVSPVVGKDTPLVSLNESICDPFSASRVGNFPFEVDYTDSLSGLEYVPQWGGVWNGLAETKRGKQVESGGTFTSEKVNVGATLAYQNFMNQGPAVESSDVFKGEAGISYRKSTDGIRRESSIGPCIIKNRDDKSLFPQKFVPGTLSGKSVDGMGIEGCTGSFTEGSVNDDVLDAKKLGFLPFKSTGTQFLGSNSPFSESQQSDPLQESSKSFFNYQKKYGPDSLMHDSASLMKPSRAVVIRAPAKGTGSPAQNPVTHKTVGTGNACIEGSFNTSKPDAAKELSSKRKFGDSMDTALKGRNASQVTGTNVFSGLSLSLDHVQAFDYPENPSDSFDNHNPAEDSPCWKGAPVFQYSPLDVVEPLTPHQLLKKLEDCFNLDALGSDIAPIVNESTRAASKNGISDSDSPAKEHTSADCGVNFSCDVAYHAAENVLGSPSALENSVDHHQPTGLVAPAKMDVPTLINAMHNLSGLLRFNCSTDASALKEQDQEVLKHVISNLDSCLSKKIVNSTPAPDSMFPRQDISNRIGEVHDQEVGKCADQSQQRYRGTGNSYGQFDRQNMPSEKMNYSESGKKAQYVPNFLLSGDTERISSDDDMVQAIRKVLDENFNFEEEMQSESILFKNLWLEAEAKLCSISYRARFDRMRIQMKENKSNKFAADVEKVSGSNSSSDMKDTSTPGSLAEDGSKPEGTFSNHSTFSSTSHAHDVQASVLARFHMLRCRDEKSNPEEQQQPNMIDTMKSGGDVEASVLARLNMLKRRDEKSNLEEQQQLDMIYTGKAEGQFGIFKGGVDPEGVIKNLSSFSNSNADDVEGSALARFNMVGRRDENSNLKDQQQTDVVDSRKSAGEFGSSTGGFDPEGTINNLSAFSTKSNADDVDASVLARLNILKLRDDKNTEDSNTVDTKKAESQFGSSSSCGVSGYESMKEFCLSVVNDPVIQPDRNGRFGNQHSSSGWYDNSSSDWEHVLKDEFLWQK